MVFQPIRRTDPLHYGRSGEPLPHLFTLAPPKRGGYFLLRYYTLADIFPLGSMALCVARTFLSANAPRWNSLLRCKDTFFRVSILEFRLKDNF